ncbi:MAG: hypothetical protein RIR56_869 [Bacteroidota bacterium]|jgi:hypothetical protein
MTLGSKVEFEFSYDQIFWNEYECIVSGTILPFEKKPESENVIIKFISIKDDLPLEATDLTKEQLDYFRAQVVRRWDLIKYRKRFHA